MIAVIDYGVGNLFSLCRSLEAIGQQPVVTGDPALLRQADKLFLPGVGAFADAAAKLRQTGLDRVIQEEAAAGKPRRYYHLTKEGQAALREKEAAWHTYAKAVGRVLRGGACCAGA